MHFSSKMIFAGALIACAVLPAKGEEYVFDLEKNNPAALAAWKAIVPAAYKKRDWVRDLAGTAAPLETAQLSGKAFYLGSVCKPHDCYQNNVVVLIAKDGSVAYGLLKSVALRARPEFFGAPDAEAKALLTKTMPK